MKRGKIIVNVIAIGIIGTILGWFVRGTDRQSATGEGYRNNTVSVTGDG